jgi:hypothetical protein
VIINCTATRPAKDDWVAREVSALLGRRAADAHAPASLVVSDAVALGIAGGFCSATPSGQVMERLYRTGRADSDALIHAARFEQDFASPEQYAALYCLILWAHSRVHRRQENSTG